MYIYIHTLYSDQIHLPPEHQRRPLGLFQATCMCGFCSDCARMKHCRLGYGQCIPYRWTCIYIASYDSPNNICTWCYTYITCVHTYTYVYSDIYIYTFYLYISLHIYIYTWLYIYTLYIYIFTCIYINTFIHIYIYIYIHIHIYIYTYIHIYIHIYMYIYSYA